MFLLMFSMGAFSLSCRSAVVESIFKGVVGSREPDSGVGGVVNAVVYIMTKSVSQCCAARRERRELTALKEIHSECETVIA